MLGVCAFSQTLPTLPLAFEDDPNGSADRPLYVGHGHGSDVRLAPDRVSVRVVAPGTGTDFRSDTVTVQFSGAADGARMTPLEPQAGVSNYLFGSDSSRWRTGVRRYGKVLVHDAYPGIDIVYYGSGETLEYDFVLAPGADSSRIALAFAGAKPRVEPDGSIALQLTHGEIRQQKPALYQVDGGERRRVEGRFVRRDDGLIGVAVGKYDPSLPLTIDPVLAYSTYWGGAGAEAAWAVALDPSGNVYVAGETTSSDFPVSGGTTLSPVSKAAFVSKFSYPNYALVYSTYLGGPAQAGGSTPTSVAYGVAVDATGAAYVTGYTSNMAFPTSNPLQAANAGGKDAFVAKLSPSGASLVYSTYLGGAADDTANAIAVDSSGSAYIVGNTASTGFPVRPGALQSTYGGGANDGFIVKLAPSGATALYASFLGGAEDDQIRALALNASGEVFAAGSTTSSNFPTLSAAQPVYGGNTDAFVSKVNASGSALVYSSFLGAGGEDVASGIVVNAVGNAFVTGWTNSFNFPVVVQLAPQIQAMDAFLTEFAPDGATLTLSTFIGGPSWDYGTGIAPDGGGGVILIGHTNARYSYGFPIISPLVGQDKAWNTTSAGFVTQVSAAGVPANFSTFLGGSGIDSINAIATDAAGDIVVVGNTTSTDFPMANATQYTYRGTSKAFISAIATGAPPRPVSVSPSAGSGAAQTFTFKFNDYLGASDLNRVEVWFTPAAILGSSAAASCRLAYLPASNTMSLADDLGVSSSSGTPGQAGQLTNRQCSVDTGAASVSTSGRLLTFTVPIAFNPPFLGTQNVWMYAAGSAGSSGWILRGKWTVTAPDHVASPASITPCCGSGNSQAFTAKFVDTAGSGFLQRVYVWFTAGGSASSAAGTCMIFYDQTDVMHLGWRMLADDGVTVLPTAPPGQNLSNSQCTVGWQYSMTNSGNVQTQNFTVTFNNAFAGDKKIWMRAVESSSDSGWQQLGAWTATTFVEPPAVITVAPMSPVDGVGWVNNSTFVVSDSKGLADLKTIQIWYTPSFASPEAGSCKLNFDVPTGQVTLRDDTGSAWLKAAAGSPSVSNTQCTVNASVYISTSFANTPSFVPVIIFTPLFAGAKEVWMRATSATGDSGWTKVGTFAVPPPMAITTPWIDETANASGPIAFDVYDIYGVRDITANWVSIGPALNNHGSGTCTFYYDAVAQRLILLDDAGAPTISGPLNVYGVLHNSQCSIGTDNPAIPNGVTLTILIPIAFSDSFIGDMEVWQNGIGVHNSTGWQKLGAWHIPPRGPVPTNVSVTPSTGAAMSGRFVFRYSEGQTPGNLGSLYMWFKVHGATGSANTCLVSYYPPLGVFNLVLDSALYASAGAPGDAAPLANSQCVVDLASSSVTVGSDVAVTVSMRFTNAYMGPKEIWMHATDNLVNGDSGWEMKGSWLVAQPGLSIAKTHSGDFTPGQTNVTYSIVVSNAATAGTTTAPIAVTEAPPTAFTVRSMGGTGWTCASLTCTRGDALAPGASLPAITVTGDVAQAAVSPLVNNVSVSLGGTLQASGSDLTHIVSPATISSSPSGLAVTVDGAAVVTPQTFSWDVGSTHTITAVSPQGTGPTRYAFSNWSDSGAQSHAAQFTGATSTYAAAFLPEYRLTANTTPSGGGAITTRPAGSGGYFPTGTSVEVTAVPAAGYNFVGLAGDLSGGLNSSTIVMDAPHAITASFAPIGTAPAAVSVSPNGASGSIQTFTGVFSAANGYHDLQWVQMLFAVATDGGGQAYCFVHYDVQGNGLWLYGDGGFFVGPVTPEALSNRLQNSLCALNTSGSTVTGTGTTLTLNASIVFKQAGARNVYMRAMNLGQADTGWVQRGTWNHLTAAQGTMSANPAAGSGTTQTFTLTYPDPPGFAGAAFGWVQFLVAAATDGGGQPFCFVHYDRGGNGLWMYSGDAGYFVGPVTPGTASNALSSSACSVNTAGATVSNTNGNLVVTLPITMKAPMSGVKKTFQRTLDVLNRDTGWQQSGTWTIQ